jgi:uncharacterized protein YbbK (DUF523 family)
MSRNSARIRVGVSSCLLGNPVRYDGGHRRSRVLLEAFPPEIEWVPVCPEVEAGLGVPRPTLRRVRSGGQLRLREHGSQRDRTDALRSLAGLRLPELALLEICGFVFKAGSPSCGLVGLPLEGEQAGAQARGIFADLLTRAMPELPVEQEDRLEDREIRERFLREIDAYRSRAGPG